MPRHRKDESHAQPAWPRVHLAIDNCFASKRWTAPAEWARVVKDLGLTFVEASADTECDPLYSDAGYLEDWLDRVEAACQSTGVQVANLYSGHGTYATLGLGHTDARNRRRMLDNWLKVMVASAARLQAGLGFYVHAFCDAVLQDRRAYEAAEQQLYDDLAELAAYARQCGLRAIGVEQMYTPHQTPWTIVGARRLLGEVLRRAGHPFYITIDTGHQSGQRKFLRPRRTHLKRALVRFRTSGKLGGLWLGTNRAYGYFRQAGAATASRQDTYLRKVEAEMDGNLHLFASAEDGDPYAWLEQLACYAPIIHLQQTDGNTSDHLPFTSTCNRKGIIRPDKVLKAIAASYARPVEPGMPPRCTDIYMTLELFSWTKDTTVEILERLADSVACWRKHIPADGLTLADLTSAKRSADNAYAKR